MKINKLLKTSFVIINLFFFYGCAHWGHDHGQVPIEEGIKNICNKASNPSDEAKEVKSFWVNLNNFYKDNDKRKLVVFMDGTLNDMKTDTNIWQLYIKSLKQACTENNPVIPFYIKGLGTDRFNLFGGATQGLNSDKKIQKAYSFLAQTYKKGDEVFLFGFSRGAFTARSLNGMLKYVGLLKMDSTYNRVFDDDALSEKVKELYRLYNDENYHDGTQTFLSILEKKIAKILINRKIEVYKYADKDVKNPDEFIVSAIGVFDTVPALGGGFTFDPRSLSSGTLTYYDPSDHRTDLYALKGFHAMSIDEQRTAFQLLRFRNKTNYLEEVWFAGGHENIGGQNASFNAEIDQGLSKITLNWMEKRFKEYKIFPENVNSSPCIHNGLNCEKGKLWDDFLYPLHYNLVWEKGRMLRRWPKDNDLVHESVFCRRDIKVLEPNKKLRELANKYIPENLGKQEYYNKDEKYSSTVKYNCGGCDN